MSLNPFESVGDYPKMLNKIGLSTFIVLLLGLTLLRYEFAPLDRLLSPFSVPVPLADGLSLPFGTVLPALVLALISRILKLHDRLSDLFHIRQRFDVGEILFPLAIGSGASLKGDQIRAIKRERESLMYKVFYKYASSTPGKAVIDTHYITLALDQWCWYWMVLELTFLMFLVAATFLLTRRDLPAAIFFLVVLCLVGLLQVIRNLCSDYALQEVEAILADTGRKAQVAEDLRAL